MKRTSSADPRREAPAAADAAVALALPMPQRESGAVPRDGVGFLWQQFSAYHMDRCEAVGESMRGRFAVYGVELATRSRTYDWEPTADGVAFTKLTLFPDSVVDHLGVWPTFKAMRAAVSRHRIRHLFLAGYELPAIALFALWLRLTGVRIYVALDSKFDDKPRRLGLELIKQLLMLPYHGGFASGLRAREYLRFLGLRKRPVALGYDTVSLDRLRALAPDRPIEWEARPFLFVGRLVPKKNPGMTLSAYAAFRAAYPQSMRRLRLCGGGPEEARLRAQAEMLGIAGWVDFLGSSGQATVAAEMAAALCLLLPSLEEQWGLVVNEALAFGLPLVVSDNVGARDLLVGNWNNGFVLDPDDAGAWCAAMILMATDASCWQRMCGNSRARARRADTAAFVLGVEHLVDSALPSRKGQLNLNSHDAPGPL